MRPAYLTISAFVMALSATLLGLLDSIPDADAALVLGLAVVIAVIGTKE